MPFGFAQNSDRSVKVDVLVVAGGGSGGARVGGGGGGGGVVYSGSIPVTSPLNVVIGNGGSAVQGFKRGISGGNSLIYPTTLSTTVEGTVNYWKLDGNGNSAVDGSGLSIAGSMSYSSVAPIPDDSISWAGPFSNNANYFYTQNISGFNTTQGSISFEFLLTDVNNGSFMIYAGGNTSNRALLFYCSSNNFILFSRGTELFSIAGAGKIIAGQKYYGLINWGYLGGGSGISAHIGTMPNNLKYSGSSTTAINWSNLSQISIGNDVSAPNAYTRGYIGNVRLSNVCRTTAPDITSFSQTISAYGGGGGGYYTTGANLGYPNDGGSGGGGGGYDSIIPGAGVTGQGYVGGSGIGGAAGGGGGAGQAGGIGLVAAAGTGGSGGSGIAYNISGISTYYAGGGGGSANGVGGAGGQGGGGNGTAGGVTPGSGATYYGGGGGGVRDIGDAGNFISGPGYSGIAIIRYNHTNIFAEGSGGTITRYGDYTVHTFTSRSSTFTPPSL